MKINNILRAALAILICELAGILGSVFTVSAIPNWYEGIVKPALNPPGWVFGPVWTLLYALMGISAFLVWRQGWGRKDVKKALRIFAFQLGFNAIWSVIFFGMHNPGLALADIVLLWLYIAWTIILFYKISKPAAYLLIPYILWVSFATYLNYSIWILN